MDQAHGLRYGQSQEITGHGEPSLILKQATLPQQRGKTNTAAAARKTNTAAAA
jgi:hypothetical protein